MKSGVFNKKKLTDLSVYGVGQAINLLSPLLVLPYLIALCGEKGLGKIGVGFSTALILNSIIDYGSYITGVKDISINRENKEYVVDKAKAIFTSKLILLLIVLVVMSIFILTVPFFSRDKELFFLSLSVVVGQFLNPAWFFQGVENYKLISIINIFSRVLYVALIFIFIKDTGDYIYVNLFFGTATILAGIAGIAYIISQYKVGLKGLRLEPAFEILKAEFSFSVSQVMLSAYQYIPIILISYLLGDFVAGQYRVIDQLVSLIKSYLNIFFYFVFANICYELNMNLKKGLSVWKQYNLANFVFVLLIVAVFFAGAEYLLAYIMKDPEAVQSVVWYFRLALMVPLLVAISLPLRQLMFAFDKNRVYITITMLATGVNIIMLMLLTPHYGLTGAFASIIIIEIIIIVLYAFVLQGHIKKLKVHENKAQ